MPQLHKSLGFLPAAAALLLVTACDQPAQTDTGTVAAAPMGPTAAPGPSDNWNGGETKPLSLQVAHPNGTVLQLTSIQSRDMDTAVGVRVINGRERDIDLNRFNTTRNGFLQLDTGEKLYLSPPATNNRLTVPAGQTFEGELVFLGRLPAVNSGILVLNENSSADSESTTTPGFRVDLPLGPAPAGASQ